MRRRPNKKRSEFVKRSPPGSSPGLLVADPGAAKTQIDVIAYGPEDFFEVHSIKPSDIPGLRAKHPLIWVNVCGLGDIGVLREIGELFGLHPLSLEDSINVYQRPKIELYGDYYYVVARMAEMECRGSTEQLSLFFAENFVLTIQEKIGDCFDPIRERIRSAKGRIRNLKADYLAYAILDATIDFYFPLLEKISNEVESIEENIADNPNRGIVRELYKMRHEFMTIRRAISPLRDAIAIMHKEPNQLIQEVTRPYLRDCYDHTVQILDSLESNRELITSLMEVYLSMASYKLNDVMRTLTVISILFMPLNLIAGIYGMNFKTEVSQYNMPELSWTYGYPFALGLMCIVGVSMFFVFHKRGWMRD